MNRIIGPSKKTVLIYAVQIPTFMEPNEISETFVLKYGITPREKKVIELLKSGLSTKEISSPGPLL